MPWTQTLPKPIRARKQGEWKGGAEDPGKETALGPVPGFLSSPWDLLAE